MQNSIGTKIGIDAIRLQMMQTIQTLNSLETHDVKAEVLQSEIEKSKTLNSLYATYVDLAITEVKYEDLLLRRQVHESKGDLTEQIAKQKNHSNFFKSLV